MDSQNAAFSYTTHGDDPLEPLGRELAQTVVDALNAGGMRAESPENWRDSGWSSEITIRELKMYLALAQTLEPGEWMLQIAVANQPGFLGRLFGKRPVDASIELTEVARIVHAALQRNNCSMIRWGDGDPTDPGATPVPSLSYRMEPHNS